MVLKLISKNGSGNLDSFHVARDKNKSVATVNTTKNFWSLLVSGTLHSLMPNSDIIFTVINVKIIKCIN